MKHILDSTTVIAVTPLRHFSGKHRIELRSDGMFHTFGDNGYGGRFRSMADALRAHEASFRDGCEETGYDAYSA